MIVLNKYMRNFINIIESAQTEKHIPKRPKYQEKVYYEKDPKDGICIFGEKSSFCYNVCSSVSEAKDYVEEHNSKLPEEVLETDDNPCWDGYKMVGMKKKGKREVPNCIPDKKK